MQACQAGAQAWRPGLAGSRRSRRQRSLPAAVPYGTPPPPPIDHAPLAPASVVQRVLAPLPLEAPPLADLIDQAATQPHWGRATAERAAAQLAQSAPGFGALEDALHNLQAKLASSLDQLSQFAAQPAARPQQPGSGQAAPLDLEWATAQLQQVAAAAQQAVEVAQRAAAPLLGEAAPGEVGTWAGGEQAVSRTYAGYSLPTLAAVAAGVAALIALAVPRDDGGGDGGGGGGSGGGGGWAGGASGGVDGSDVLPSRWDADAVSRYYSQRPVLVARRVLRVGLAACGWGIGVLSDMATGTVERNQEARADQLVAVISALGVAPVKIAQAFSTRVDLLPPAYFVAIQRLQDRVAPFPDSLAYAAIEEAFGGVPLGQVFSSVSSSAVAAASLGQVYRGTLRASGMDVAIKVRRPGVLESVTLDLHLMRGVAMQLRSVPQVKSDWVGIIDSWATQFIEEIDYQLEAQNTARMAADLASLPGVVVPDVVEATPSVLVTSWIDGERLSNRRDADVRQLCNTLLTAYLMQLLETGLLHADPHTGNLLVTPDGRVALLDHGLVQKVPRDYALSLLEYIAHLSVGDWDSLADDLVNLGFVESVADRERLVVPLGRVLSELTKGGGLDGGRINISVVSVEIEKLSQEFDFKVPPAFTLILRCFSTLEGIALQSDPQYSIVQECFPYLARRLLTDDDPRAREALRQLLFVGDQISLERVRRVVEGLSSYTVDGLSSPRPAAPQQVGTPSQPTPLLDSTAAEVLQAVFSQRPTYVQQLLVEQAVNTTDAAVRQLASLVLGPALGGIAAAPVALSSNSAPAFPVFARLPSLVELTAQDEQQLQTARGIVSLLQQQPQVPPTPQQVAQLVRELAPLLPGIATTGQLFVSQLGQRAYSRVAAVVQDRSTGDDDNRAYDALG